MTILLAAGIALLLFGAVVLLRFPDRPGGRIGWQGFDVSSAGAGLPLIALGVAAIAVGAVRGNSSSSARGQGATTSSTTGGDCFQGVEQAKTIEAGASDVEVIRPDQPKTEPVWLRFTEGGDPIGGLRFRFFPDSELFKIERVVDARCAAVEPVENVDRGGDPRALQNWDTVRLRLDDRFYDMRIGASSDVRVNFTAVS